MDGSGLPDHVIKERTYHVAVWNLQKIFNVERKNCLLNDFVFSVGQLAC